MYKYHKIWEQTKIKLTTSRWKFTCNNHCANFMCKDRCYC